MKIANTVFVMLALTTLAQGREPPVCFPPDIEKTDTSTLARCEAVLDRTVFPVLTFSNTPVKHALGYLVDSSPRYDPSHSGLSMILKLDLLPQPQHLLLPPTPERITLSLTNVTYRQALDEICQRVNLSWRLFPMILVARPEHFIEADKKRRILPGS